MAHLDKADIEALDAWLATRLPPTPAAPKPGVKSSELWTTILAIVTIAGIVAGLLFFATEIETLTGETKAIAIGLVGAVASWAVKRLGETYTTSRTAVKTTR